MYAYVKRAGLSLSVLLMLGLVFASVAFAWGPPGRDGWYHGPDGGWHQGSPWGVPQYPSGYPYFWPDGYTQYPYPSPYYKYEGYYAPACPLPAPPVYIEPSPPVYVEPPPCAYPLSEPYTWSGPIPTGMCYSAPPVIPDRYHIQWGTFGTYDNWARAFYREHGRCPNEQDVRDFWWSQAYAATHCGRSPW